MKDVIVNPTATAAFRSIPRLAYLAVYAASVKPPATHDRWPDTAAHENRETPHLSDSRNMAQLYAATRGLAVVDAERSAD